MIEKLRLKSLHLRSRDLRFDKTKDGRGVLPHSLYLEDNLAWKKFHVFEIEIVLVKAKIR